MADIVTASGHAGYQWDLDADHIIWFGLWQPLFGDNVEHPPYNAETLSAVIHPDDQYLVFGSGSMRFDREFRIRKSNGQMVWVHEHGTTDCEAGRCIRQRGLLCVIDGPRKVAMSTAQAVVETDLLTGRPNRTAMLDRLDKVMEGARDIKHASAYMVVSIDKMSFVNEAVGTKSGDELLRSMGDRLCEICPTKSIVARVGGDMFGILLPNMARDLNSLAERILQSFRERHLTSPAGPLHITVSIGSIRTANLDIKSPEAMIKAEQALKEARQQGRNKYCEYKESATRAQENRAVLEISEQVKMALKQDKLRLAYQPVIDTETGKVLFYEALARMFRDDGQIMAAAEFIPVVEQQGLEQEFDRHVLDIAIKEMEAAPDLRLAVNISGLTASNTEWPEYIQRILKPRPHIARRLIIEITETAAIVDVTETKRLVDSLKQLGSQVALDDFGAGSTSIRHLRNLSLAIMKIDRELLLNIIDNAEQQHLVRMLIIIARGLNLKTVAEGVESEPVAQWLRREKVDMMQGYYFGRPSLSRPWLELKDAEAPETRTQELLGVPPAGDKPGPVEFHVASFVHV